MLAWWVIHTAILLDQARNLSYSFFIGNQMTHLTREVEVQIEVLEEQANSVVVNEEAAPAVIEIVQKGEKGDTGPMPDMAPFMAYATAIAIAMGG